jgi:CRP-like cAMP-binding protein
MKLEAFLSTLVPLDPGELDFLRPLIHIETFEKGMFYLRNGQTCKKVSFINEGLFKMSVVDSTGSEKNNRISGCPSICDGLH